MLRKACVYKKGLKIIVYSKKKVKEEKISCYMDIENAIYYTNYLFINNNSKKKRTLKMNLNMIMLMYLANCLPYFYSKLTKGISYYGKAENNNNFIFTKRCNNINTGRKFDVISLL